MFDKLMPATCQHVLDIGSRMGVVAYGASIFTSGNVSTIGVEMDADYAALALRTIRQFGLKNVEILRDDIRHIPHVFKENQFIVMNNVFSFFLSKTEQEECWEYLHTHMLPGTVLAHHPPIEKITEHLDLSFAVEDWLEFVNTTEECLEYGRNDEDIFEEMQGICKYIVKNPNSGEASFLPKPVVNMYNESNCQQMAQVATSPALRTTLSVLFLLCLICLPVNFYALWRILISVKLHFNSKCVLFVHNLFVLIHLVSRIVLHGTDLLNYFGTWESGCDIIPSRSRCELRVFYKYSTFIIEVSPFILMIERFVATFQARYYENRYKWLGGLLNILHLSLGLLFMFIQTSTNAGEVVIYYCWLANYGNRILVNVPTFFIFTSQLATIPGLLYLLRKNEMNLQNLREVALHIQSTLTERYQISENLRTSSMFRIMSVVTWVYVAYNAAASYAGTFVMHGMGFADQFAFVEIIHCIPVYYIVLSIFIIRIDRKPREAFVVKVNSCQTHYFSELQKFFDEAFEKISIRRNRVEPFQKGRTSAKFVIITLSIAASLHSFAEMATESDCQQMAQVATSSYLRSVLTITTLLCFFCIPCSVYSLWRLQRSTKLHFNSKCIFITHNVFILTHMIVRIGLHGKDLINYFGPWTSGCEIFPSRTRCEFRILYKISAYIVEVSPFILTIERFVATFQARRYENRFKWLGVSLIVFHILLALSLLMFQKSENSGEAILYYCWLASTGNRYVMNIPVFFVLLSQFITIPCLLYLLRKNTFNRDSSMNILSTLTQRYQIYENLRTLKMFRIMSYITWGYVAWNAIATFSVYFFLKGMSQAQQFGTIEIVHCLPLYFLILTGFILREDRKPQNQFTIRVNNYEPHYFNGLKNFFDEAFEKIHPKSNKVAPMETKYIC